MEYPKRNIQAHTPLYEQFIENQEIILSLPLTFRWTHNPFLLCEGNTIKEKLPIRVYMGASFLSEDRESEITSIQCYNTRRGNYYTYPTEHLIPKYKEWKTLLQTLLPKPIQCTLLIETEPGKGFEVHEHTAHLMSYCISLLREEITPQELIQGISSEDTKSLIKERTQALYQLLCPFRPPTTLLYTPPESYQRKRFWKEAGEIIPLPEETPLPFFYSILYSGVQAEKQLIREPNTTKQGHTEHIPCSAHMTPHVEELAKELKDTFLAIQEGGGKGEHLEHFFHLITLTSLYHHHHRTPHPAIKTLTDLLHHHCAHTSHKQFATVPISYSHLGGSILLCYTNRDTEYCIQELLKQKQQEGYPYSLEWSSTTKGEEEGIRIEKYAAIGIQSNTEEKEYLVLWKNGQKEKRFVSKAMYQELQAQCDLFLDPLQGKIWVGGKAMSSKELHSQQQTIFLLQSTLEHPKHRISNEELPRSSYSTNRNEIGSKILSPLRKVLKEEGRGECPFTLEGRLGTFQLCYQKSALTIAIRTTSI